MKRPDKHADACIHLTLLIVKAAILTMHKRMTRSLGLAILLIATLLGSTAGSAYAVPETAPQGDALRAQLAAWAKGLAGEPGFGSFAQAVIEVTPLGPGTHSWLALLREPGKPNVVGYMVVHAVQSGGYQLGEYGLGDYHPFAEQTLRLGLARLGLIDRHNKQPLRLERLYPNAMLAAWRITAPGPGTPAVYYLDAKTGEELPADDLAWQEQLRTLEADEAAGTAAPRAASAFHAAVSTASGESFDPYERMPWLTRPPLAHQDAGELAVRLQAGAELRLTFDWFDGGYLHVLPIAAVQSWDDGASYVAVDQEGLRFLPYDGLVQPYGSIYD